MEIKPNGLGQSNEQSEMLEEFTGFHFAGFSNMDMTFVLLNSISSDSFIN